MSGQTVEVASESHHTVKPWFAGRVPVSPPVADFTEQGFALLGGRALVARPGRFEERQAEQPLAVQGGEGQR